MINKISSSNRLLAFFALRPTSHSLLKSSPDLHFAADLRFTSLDLHFAADLRFTSPGLHFAGASHRRTFVAYNAAINMAFFENKAKVKLTLFKLRDASEFTRWKNMLQDHMFKKIHNNNMDRLTTADTLDINYFKLEFKDEHKAASKDAFGASVNPLTDAAFLQKCTDHAFAKGEGFHDWLYILYADVRTALSDAIQDQTAGVVRGDLIKLLQAIKLAVHHSELNNPDALEIQYSKCTMELEGKQDLMTFTTALTTYMRSLDPVGLPVRDAKAQRVLLEGLDQDIFENFIANAKRTPYANYASLQKALEETASTPRILKKLAGLKPGLAQSSLTTQAQSHSRPQQSAEALRMDKIEAILVSMAQSMKGADAGSSAKANCHAWER